MKIAYVVDSSFIVPIEKRDSSLASLIHHVPLVLIDPEHKTYEDPVLTVSHDELLELFKKFSNAPFKTSITSTGVLEQKLNELLKEYDYVVALPIAKSLSNQMESFEALSRKPRFANRFYVSNSFNIPFASYIFLELLNEQLQLSESLTEETFDKAKKYVERILNVGVFIITNDIKRLSLSGRLSKAKSSFARLMGLKIALEVNSQLIDKLLVGKSTYKVFNEGLTKIMKKNSIDQENATLAILGIGQSSEKREKINSIAKTSVKNVVSYDKLYLPSIMSAHIGNDVIAAVVYEIKR